MFRSPFFRRLFWLVLFVILLGLAFDFLPQLYRSFFKKVTPRAVTPRGELASDEKATIEIFERAKDAVVFISTSQQVMDLWTRNIFSVPQGSGSGFIWDEQGHIVTNFHVIADASEARVRLSNGKELKAGLVGVSPAHDIAVLKIGLGSQGPAPLPVGTSHDLKVGQKVFAIGNPFGFDWTLTTGIISALDRSLPLEENGRTIEHLIQTDAAINPGNSGGPLLDSAGRLIGMNTAIYSPSGAWAGVGFAVPVDTINRVVPQLIAYGKYIRPTLGIAVDESINQIITKELGITGVAVLKVFPGSAAAAAGLQEIRINEAGELTTGDFITEINGKQVDSVAKLQGRLDDFRVGDRVTLTVLRLGKKKMEVSVILQAG